MRLDEERAVLLAALGVVLEQSQEDDGDVGNDEGDHKTSRQRPPYEERTERTSRARYSYGTRGAEALSAEDTAQQDEADRDAEITAVADLSLFQTSREHYGVFYRLDLTLGVPHLRIYMPEDEGQLKIRCYLVRAAQDTPLHEWFITAREHEGSPAYEEARDTAQQHLLFAAGELMKRLFWSGDVETMHFPDELAVIRIA